MIGTQIGDYRIERLLGRGGSTAYLYEHVRLKRFRRASALASIPTGRSAAW